MYTVGISTHICCIMKWKQTQVNMQYMGGMDILLQHNKIIWINMSMTTFKGILEQSFSMHGSRLGCQMDPLTIWYVLQIESFHINQNYSLILVVQSCCRDYVSQIVSTCLSDVFFNWAKHLLLSCTQENQRKHLFRVLKNSPFFSSTWLVGPIYEKMNKNRTSQMEDFYCLNDFMCQRNHVLEGSVMSL